MTYSLDLGNGITAVIFVTVREAAYKLLWESWSWLLPMKLQTLFSQTFLYWVKKTFPGLHSSYLVLGLWL